MKKALLFAATALLAGSSALAETRYFQAGDPITDISQMKDDDHGGLYLIQGFTKQRNHSGFFAAYKDGNNNRFRYTPDDVTTISETGEDESMAFKIAFVEGEENTFTVQNCQTQQYLSVKGQNGIGKHNAVPTTDGSDFAIAQFTLLSLTGRDILVDTDVLKDYRFIVQSTNQYFDGNENNGRFYWFSNDLGGGGALTYHQALYVDGNCQVAFFPVKAAESRQITVTLPAILGTGTTTETIVGFDGISAEKFIQDKINELGGMTDVVIKSQEADNSLIVSETNVNFTVEGDWMADFEAENVYRLCVNPSDSPSALRYMLLTGEIRTKIDGMETLSRLIPERLWFFKKTTDGDDTYTMHNLYNPEVGVHFEGTANGAVASYTEDQEATVFQKIPTAQHNQFYLKINGTENAYVSDNGGNGVFTINNIATPDANCLIQFYPLENRDMEALNLATNLERTVDNVKSAVEAYNAQNIAAAIRRIEYWGGEQLVGWQPGRFNNATNDFHIKLQEAKALLEQGDAADAEAVKQAVEDISFEKLTVFNEIKPGMFYRFKNKLSGKYISSIPKTVSGTTSMELVASAAATRSNTVFYVDGPDGGPYTIVSFDTGLVLPKMESGNSWVPVVNGTDDASNAYTIVHQHLGGCVLHSVGTGNSHRHLYGGEATNPRGVVLASSGDSSNKVIINDAHQWYVELVEELPVPLYNSDNNTDAWASVYSPVALQIQNGEAVAHTGKFNGTHVEKTKHGDGTTIPANTSVLLDYKGGAEGSVRYDNRSYIYLKVLYPTNEAEAALYYDGDTEVTTPTTPELKDLNGGIYAVTKAEGTKYFSLHETTTNNFREHSTESTYIPGFKAHIAIAENELPELTADNTDSEGNLILPIKDPVDDTTGISEVAAEGVKAVYDLQGRRLAAPAKGINIINGKKVLVK